jgi:PAT family beta-lactamase induction signal transducer AmpG
MNKRLFIVFILGFSSGLPLALLTGALQAWFSSAGLSIMTVGMVSLIGLPYSYRFLWSPLLDRYTLFSIGRRRSWIIFTQFVLLCGFNAMALFSPETSAVTMMGLAALLAFFSATQDIAIDAQRTEYLPIEEHGLGASFAILGYRIALLIGGGLSLVMASHVGWSFTYRFISCLMLIGMFVTLISPEPAVAELESQQSRSLVEAFLKPAQSLFSRTGILSLILFIIFYKIAEAFTSSTSGIMIPFLIQGLGFSLNTIGYVNKVVGASAAILGGLTSGVLLLRWSLFRSLLFFGLLQAMSVLFFLSLSVLGKSLLLLCVAVVCENFASGMSAVALVALFMRLVDRRYTATQFSMLIAFASLPRIFSGPIAASIQSWIGWVGLYEIVFLMSLGFIPLLFLVSRRQKIPIN